MADQQGRGRGRPPKAVVIDYSQAGHVFKRLADFQKFQAEYPDKRAIACYFYRLVPKINNRQIGLADHSIYITADESETTEAFIRQKFGSGKYMLTLKDSNRKGPGGQEMARTWVEIDGADCDPIYDPRSLVLSDKENGGEIARLLGVGVLIRDATTGDLRFRQDGAPVPPPLPPAHAQQQQPPAVNPQITDSVTGLLLGKLIDRAIPSLAPQSPAEAIKIAFEIADRLKPAAPSFTKEDIAVLVSEKLREMQPPAPPPAPPVDPVESAMKSIETGMKFQELMQKISGNGSGTHKPRWYEALPSIFEGAKELIPEVIRGAGQLRSMYSTAQNGSAVNRIYSPVVQPGAVQAPMPGDFPNGAAGGQGAGTGNGIYERADRHDPAPMDPNLKFMLDQYRAGVRGFHTAMFLVQARPGGLDLFRIVEGAGADGCLAFLADTPEGKLLAADPAQRTAVKVWLEDFISFDADESDEEDEEPVVEVTASAGA